LGVAAVALPALSLPGAVQAQSIQTADRRQWRRVGMARWPAARSRASASAGRACSWARVASGHR